jgi:putative transposase
MILVYQYFGMTRQAAHHAWRRAVQRAVCCQMVIDLVREIRADQPRMGLRKIYWLMQPSFIGRDRFEALAQAAGLRIAPRVSPRRTTLSQTRRIFPNRIKGLQVWRSHQVWVTDITYFQLSDRFAYIITIMDVYTRVIVAALAHRTLSADANIRTLRLALHRTKEQRNGCTTIHHSDRGSQYIDHDYVHLLETHRFLLSMCEEAWENPYVERVQGSIKNEYLYAMAITTFEELPGALARSIRLYNTARPHQSLPRHMTPRAFADWVASLPPGQRPVMVLDNTPSASERRAPAGRGALSSLPAPAPRPPDATDLTSEPRDSSISPCGA